MRFPRGLAVRGPRHWTLRVRLVALMLTLVFLGLCVSGVVVSVFLWRSMLDRVDGELTTARDTWARQPPEATAELGNPHMPPGRFYSYTLDSSGRYFHVNGFSTTPDLATLPIDGGIHTVGSESTGVRWRAVSFSVTTSGLVVPDGPQLSHDEQGRIEAADGTLLRIVAVPIASEDATLKRLLLLEAVMGAGAMICVGVVGWATIRHELRSLRQVATTSRYIASGDLDRRVPPGEPGTEVGDLSESFNRMIDDIQRSIATTEASEVAAREAADKMRRFVGDASHELRTPLTAVRGFAEAARMGAVPPEYALDRIGGEAERMGLLVEDLLLLARLDADRPVVHEPVDLSRVVTYAVDAARASWPTRTIHVAVNPTIWIMGDTDRIRQVIDNLITNALRHGGENAEVTVELDAVLDGSAEIPGGGPIARMAVVDTGVGISPAAAAKVFDRFYRVDDSRGRADTDRKSGRGAGLGLSIVSSLVDAHGGTVTLDSEVGKGSRFTILLPLRSPPEDPQQLSSPDE